MKLACIAGCLDDVNVCVTKERNEAMKEVRRCGSWDLGREKSRRKEGVVLQHFICLLIQLSVVVVVDTYALVGVSKG